MSQAGAGDLVHKSLPEAAWPGPWEVGWGFCGRKGLLVLGSG